MGLDEIQAVFSELADILAGPGSRLWPFYLLAAILICYVIYRRNRVDQPFLAWLLPKSIYFHASHIVDLKIFCVNRAIAALGFLQFVFFGAFVADKVSGLFTAEAALPNLSPVIVALLLLIVGDFCTYWVHRVHHESRIFWPFHSLHHSAEVMTPITVYRKHPIYDLIATLVRGLFVGVLQGLLLGLFTGGVSYFTLVGVNAGYVLFNMAGANLRHTHIWLSFGRVAEHVVISPAQHQIHHSLAPEHHNKNYGEVLAIWDWMFGTLYVPQHEEKLEFGLADKQGNRLEQRHDNLINALVVPVRDSWKQIIRRFNGSNKKPERNKTISPAE
ncbi:Fatty acid hydroxylase superfamily protein [Roseovarius litorisediminis]|uniref:Fatty acid hydroxylase superfamily protein n=1 Tax=Roseovarius litorisediminis TaxID=1312363 RepID=A0A1Y5R8C3_9RHOB|nr:sterol desaturase family protein [Roseovarius litorisediminis]SLN11525.1 Fatty acid hydroxylase superfamily protein [Roseovarius litorisediminis]